MVIRTNLGYLDPSTRFLIVFWWTICIVAKKEFVVVFRFAVPIGIYIATGAIRLQGVTKEKPECRDILFP